VIHDHVLIFWW